MYLAEDMRDEAKKRQLIHQRSVSSQNEPRGVRYMSHLAYLHQTEKLDHEWPSFCCGTAKSTKETTISRKDLIDRLSCADDCSEKLSDADKVAMWRCLIGSWWAAGGQLVGSWWAAVSSAR